MITRHHAFGASIALAAVFFLGAWRIDAGPSPIWTTDDPLRTFYERVESYAALHRRLADPLPRLDPDRNPWSHVLSRHYLASAIRSARATAKQGDIFSPAVGDLFRVLIADALVDRHRGGMFDLWPEESWPPEDPAVNEPFPNEASHTVPAVLLHHLPALPNEMEYRIVNGSLVLLDVRADIVIDVLLDAFRVTSYV